MPQPIEAVANLARRVLGGTVGSSDSYRFAGVRIVPIQPEPRPPGFYPEDRYVVTSHGAEVGWVFDELANAFGEAYGYGLWKDELFGRLGNAANWYLAHNPATSARDLCLAILCEASDMADEIEAHDGLQALIITTDNIIADDARWPMDAGRPSTAEQVRAYLHDRIDGR